MTAKDLLHRPPRRVVHKDRLGLGTACGRGQGVERLEKMLLPPVMDDDDGQIRSFHSGEE